jgi:hypothetical protein
MKKYFTLCDWLPHSFKQYTGGKRFFPEVNFKLSYMNDGLHYYIEYEKVLPTAITITHNIKNIGRRFIKGYKKSFPHTLGSSPLTTSVFLFYPELTKKNVTLKICNKILFNSNSVCLCKHCIDNWNIEIPNNDLALYVMPHHSRISDSVMSEFVHSITSCEKLGLISIIKNRPNNDSKFIKEVLSKIPNIVAINTPKTLPIEILICARLPKFIMGGLFSIFLATKALAKDTKFVLVGDDEKTYPKTYRNYLILLIRTLSNES